MIKVTRSFAFVCVFGAGTGLFSLAMGILAGSTAKAAAAETMAALNGAGIPLFHLLAASAIVVLSITALRMIGDLQQPSRIPVMRELREEPLFDD